MILPSDCCEFSWKLISREYLMLSDKLIGLFFFSNELFAGYCVKIVRESNNRITSPLEIETVNVTSIQL